MDDGLSQVLKKSGEARLYKLKKFVLFGASTVDHNTSSRRFFVRRDLNRKRLEWSRCDGEFIRGRNLRQASKIAKALGDKFEKFINYAICVAKMATRKGEKYFRHPSLKGKRSGLS